MRRANVTFVGVTTRPTPLSTSETDSSARKKRQEDLDQAGDNQLGMAALPRARFALG